MDITVLEAATLLDCTPRTIRNRINNGQLPATKRGGVWVLVRDKLPLPPKAKKKLERQRQKAHNAVDKVFSANSDGQGGKHWSLQGLSVFQSARSAYWLFNNSTGVSTSLDKNPKLDPQFHLHAGLQSLTQGHAEFDRKHKLLKLREARGHFASALADALLLLHPENSAGPELSSVVSSLESEILPKIGGLIRSVEGRNR